MTNEEIAQTLEDIGELLEVLGENSFKIRAYLKAAASIRLLEDSVEECVRKGKLGDIQGIGKSIARTVKEVVETGKSSVYEELISKIPVSVVQLTKVPGIGPKTAKILFESLGIIDIEGLKRAVEDGSIGKVKGVGAKTREALEKSLFYTGKKKTGHLLTEAETVADTLVGMLKKIPLIKKVSIVGPLRRMADVVENLSFVIETENPESSLESFIKTYGIDSVLYTEKNRLSFNFKRSFKVNMFASKPENFGSAMIVYTGSGNHIQRLKEIAKEKGFRLTPEGLFDIRNGKKIPCFSERDAYERIGLEYIPPFLRENYGEIEAARGKALPEVVHLDNIKSDLHIHSTWSDSSATIEEIAEVCTALNYEYIAITDHARRLKVAGGIVEEQLFERIEAINKLNNKFRGRLRILSGIELNIDKDGLLDYSNEILKSFDFIIASIHWGFPAEKEKITRRIIKAMENPFVHAIGHPTGRLLLRRLPYSFDAREVFKVASETGTAMEINAYPDRLDLVTEMSREAWEKYGIKFCIGTDAHALKHLSYIRYGVAVAQRAWLPVEAILNTYPVDEFLEIIKKR